MNVMAGGRSSTSSSGLSLALFAGVIALGYLNWSIWSSPPETSALAVPGVVGNASPVILPDEASLVPPARAIGEFQQTKARPLFFANRRPVDRNPPKVAAVVAKPAKIVPLFPLEQLQLIGIVRTGKDKVSALIRAGNDAQGAWVSVGDQVRGWKLQEVNDEIVVLESNGQRGEVKLYAAAASQKTR
jgi:hypothetical protein